MEWWVIRDLLVRLIKKNNHLKVMKKKTGVGIYQIVQTSNLR